ncbi:MAG TPA: hypothetical protein PK156_22745 [Polyangium sp.]|nr:hypothetical protein [Polyangium sp.]
MEYLLSHENSIDAFRAIVGGAHVPTTKAAAAKAPTPESPLNAPPTTKKKPRRSLAAARTVGITETAVVASPPMPPDLDPMELPKQFVRESNHSVPITQEEIDAAERWRLLTAA